MVAFSIKLSELPALHLRVDLGPELCPYAFITCDNGDTHYQLQTALCISIINLAAHYTSVLDYPSSWMIAYCYQLTILISSHNFHVAVK